MSDRPTPVGAQLRAAPPDRLPEVVADQLRRHHAAGRVEVLLGDLTLSGLWPVIDESGPAGGPPARRCFGSQRPVTEINARVNRVHLPLSAWGERLGVLIVETTRPAGDGLTEQFGEGCGVVGEKADQVPRDGAWVLALREMANAWQRHKGKGTVELARHFLGRGGRVDPVDRALDVDRRQRQRLRFPDPVLQPAAARIGVRLSPAGAVAMQRDVDPVGIVP